MLTSSLLAWALQMISLPLLKLAEHEKVKLLYLLQPPIPRRELVYGLPTGEGFMPYCIKLQIYITAMNLTHQKERCMKPIVVKANWIESKNLTALDINSVFLLRMAARTLMSLRVLKAGQYASRISNRRFYPTNHEKLLVHVDTDLQTVSLVRTNCGTNYYPLVTVHTESGHIQWDHEEVRRVYPSNWDDATVVFGVLRTLARVEYSMLNHNNFAYTAMLTHKTRRLVKDFFGLMQTVARYSQSATNFVSRNLRYTLRIAGNDEHVSLYDGDGWLVIRLGVDSFELGPNFEQDLDFNKTLYEIITNVRVPLLQIRHKVKSGQYQFEQSLDNWDMVFRRACNEAERCAREIFGHMGPLDLVNHQTSLSMPEGSYTMTKMSDGCMLSFPMSATEQGSMVYIKSKKKLVMGPKELDYWRDREYNPGEIHVRIREMGVKLASGIANEYLERLQKRFMEKNKLSYEQYELYAGAYSVARKNNYNGTFDDFVVFVSGLMGQR